MFEDVEVFVFDEFFVLKKFVEKNGYINGYEIDEEIVFFEFKFIEGFEDCSV